MAAQKVRKQWILDQKVKDQIRKKAFLRELQQQIAEREASKKANLERTRAEDIKLLQNEPSQETKEIVEQEKQKVSSL
jgi:hypothetical protein